LTRKEKMIRIRSTKETKKDFGIFVIKHDFKDSEDAIKTLMIMAENHPELLTRAKVRFV